MSASKIAVAIPDHLFTHPAYRALPPTERVILIELLALAKRVGTDEPVVCSVAMAANMANVKRSVAARALLSLRKRGFIAIVNPDKTWRGATAGVAAEYRITCLPYQGEPPSAEYNLLHWKAVDASAPTPPETSLSNAPPRTFETASDGPERGTANGKFAHMSPPSGTVPYKPLKSLEANVSKSGRTEFEPSPQRHATVPPAGRSEPAKLRWGKPVVRELTGAEAISRRNEICSADGDAKLAVPARRTIESPTRNAPGSSLVH
jgi:hypothetical protein